MPPRGVQQRGAASLRGTVARGGTSRGGGVAQAGIAASHVKTIGVKRTAFGTGGVATKTLVNGFEVTNLPDGNIYHYDALTPDNLPAKFNNQIFTKLVQSAKGTIFKHVAPAYDGKKNAFTKERLPLKEDATTFDVSLESGNSDRPPRIYKLRLTLVSVINTQMLNGFIEGTQSLDNAVFTAISALNVAIRMGPNQKYTFNTRSFFTPEGKRLIGKGMELWRGYFQSIRPTFGRMFINLDIATGVMYRAGPLLDLFLEFFEKRDPKIFDSQKGFPDRERVRIQRFVTGVRVVASHAPNKPFSIKGLTAEGADRVTFQNKEGVTMTVANYFKAKRGKPLQFPTIVCAKIGASAVVPLELLDVLPGQIMRKQIPADKTNAMVEFSKMLPKDRLASIRHGLEVLNYVESEYVKEFGLNIANEPMTVQSRILPAPKLRYGVGSAQATIQPQDGAWNMRDKRFFRPVTIKSWIIVIYESQTRFREEHVRSAISGFLEAAKSVGMTVADPNPLHRYVNSQGDISNQLKQVAAASRQQKNVLPELIVVILPEGGNDIYTAVKHFGDCEAGVTTQCLKSLKCHNAKIQYWANVMLKVNVKLGGINAVVDNSALNDPANPTIIMGADAIHPAPGADGRPSFAALVSSVDSTTAKYVANIRVQAGRQEIIEELEDMVKEAIGRYKTYQTKVEMARKPPTRLIFYRDGVSEGQFQEVVEKELSQIKNACAFHKINPKITLIVVGKRHHIRMFPLSNQDADRSGNCKAGTTIDQGIGHPSEQDYYQLTHGGLLGTSRPAHYSVLYDDNGFSPDALQNMSFTLCHVYARATRSVSIPAPVYYADIVCARAKCHYSPTANIDLSDTATATSGQGYIDSFKTAFKPAHTGQAGKMYFM